MINRFKLAFRIFVNPHNRVDQSVIPQMEILKKLGQERSISEGSSVDIDGNPLPWFTYPAIEYLSQIDFSNHDVLEWGSGNSTRYFSSRCKNIVSIEHNHEWFLKLKDNLPDNVNIIFSPESAYSINPLELNNKYDLIIVDGVDRLNCLKSSLKLIKDSGMIIFDNSDRNPEFCEFMRSNKLVQVDFHGFGPINKYTWTTSIFFSKGVKFKALSIQPSPPVGGGF